MVYFNHKGGSFMSLTMKENEFIEFKESLSQLDKGIKSLTAMLNRAGYGMIYFGVKDNGDVCGVSIGEKTLQNIRHRIQEIVFPQIIIRLKKEIIEEKEVIILASEGSEIPYSCDGRYYIRNISSDEQIHPQLLRKMLEVGDCDLIKNSKSYIQELSFNQFKEYSRVKGIHVVGDGSNFLRSKGFYDRDGDYNLMSFLLSDQSSVSIKIVKFNGKDKTSFSERTEYGYKCLLNSIDDVLSYIKSINTTKIDVASGITRKEISLFNFESFREAWINACLHNRWSEMIPPSVFIFDNRIEVVSYGDIPYNLSKEDFYNGSSVPINKTLKDIFVSLGLAEQSGHGVPVIVSNYGKGAFSFESCTIKVTIPFAFEPDFVIGRKAKENILQRLTDNQISVLKFLRDNPTSTQIEIAEKLNISVPGVKKIVLRLQELELLSREGSKKAGYWNVKVYCDSRL